MCSMPELKKAVRARMVKRAVLSFLCFLRAWAEGSWFGSCLEGLRGLGVPSADEGEGEPAESFLWLFGVPDCVDVGAGEGEEEGGEGDGDGVGGEADDDED